MENCYEGTSIPDPITAPCGGEYVSTDCVATPSAIAALEIAAGATQTQINSAVTNALLAKEEQITTLSEDIAPFTERKVYRGAFLGSVLSTPAEDTINDIAIDNAGTGVYNLTSSSFTTTTSVVITPNAVSLGFTEVTITYDYTAVLGGTITFLVKNNGTLVDLLESPIKIEI